MSLIRNKKSKISAVTDAIGSNITEKLFIEKYKAMYPLDWEKIQKRWEAGIPDMQEPNVYMKEMYRNHVK